MNRLRSIPSGLDGIAGASRDGGSPRRWSVPVGGILVGAAALASCWGPSSTQPDSDNGEPSPNALACNLDLEFLADPGVPRDGIRALEDPGWVTADVPLYLEDHDRVVGIRIDGSPYAVPLNLLWYHEIANVTVQGQDGPVEFAVTYCPLTGSALVFDRAAFGGSTFGVSGILYKSNLVMYDRATGESLGPQMLGEARCGPAAGTRLSLHPAIEITWAGWRALHPDTRVLGKPDWDGPYGSNPYRTYEARESYSYPMPQLDRRRPLKERVLGIGGVEGPSATGQPPPPSGSTLAFPFGTLATLGDRGVVQVSRPGNDEAAVVLWDGRGQAAMAYSSQVGSQHLTFEAGPAGIVDAQTSSTWSVEGVALTGPLEAERLEPLPGAYIAFWGAWYGFFPSTELWGPGKPGEP